MSDILILCIYAAGIIQAIFLIGTIASLRLRNRVAVNSLIALMALMTIGLAEQFADVAGAPGELALGLALELGMAPLLFIFARAVAYPDRGYSEADALHFAPLILALFFLAATHQVNTGGNLGVAHPSFGDIIVAWVCAKFAYFAGYAVVIERMIAAAASAAKGKRAAQIGRVRKWLWIVFAAVTLSYAFFFLYVAGAQVWRDSDTIAGVILFSVIFSIAYLAIVQRELLDGADPKSASVSAQARAEAERVRSFMTSERPYLEPDFTIARMASETGLSVAAARAAVEALSGERFADYLNSLRLTAFEALARDPANREKTTLELAFAAGFNSKATFYRVFSAKKGVAPREYREKIVFS